MATKFIAIFFIFHLLTSSNYFIESRPLTDSKPDRSYMNIAIQDLFSEFYVAARRTGGPSGVGFGDIKNSGPSAGGRGHGYVNAEMKNSGPSSGGKGHADITEEKKYSGPSAGGKGHAFVNADTAEGMKNAEPSEGGKGSELTNAEREEAKNLGPWAGGKGHEFNTLGEENTAGPSPRGKGH
ncbi:hypothetical protein DCAR_0309980 [Daucus carota subsp. sativus]|uniref:Nodule-specific Glycine Rich Peptide n=1 Tax=Daucus carota subsp. sativus TaxID=79200 RepID=A0AAF1ASH9_DAUCS|nr:hypothetical protein DCAR_0309980 [Daucus carota subsp. sativus]